jgi:ribosomal protein L22
MADEQEQTPETPDAPEAQAAAKPADEESAAKKPRARKPAAKAKAEGAADESATGEDAAEAQEATATKAAPKAKAKAAAKADKAEKPAKAPKAKTAKAEGGEKAEKARKAPARRRGKAAAQETEEAAVSAEQPRRAARAGMADGRRTAVRARARYVRTSARKARMVCGHLRGKSVQEARAILAFTPRDAARDWSKLLESAVANAENNHELLEDDLVVREAYADEGPTIKRFRPRAMGRATPIRKRTSHLTITLTPRETR